MQAINTGVRLTVAQMEKLTELAKSLNTNRNRTIALLIESATVEQLPVVSVALAGAHSANQQNKQTKS